MKLQDLKESMTGGLQPGDVIHHASDNLIVEVGIEDENVMIHIIRDVPPISKQQFKQLLQTSFESGSVASHVDISPLPRYWLENNASLLNDYFGEGQADIFISSWKEFIAHVKEGFPTIDDDDFDE